MKENRNVKYRNEIKYLCSEKELCLIKNRIQEICKPDMYTGEDGKYTIRSVYFDDYQNSCFYENENGTNPREKYRIRTYNGSLERITLECKRKENGLNHKTACQLTKEQCKKMLRSSFSLQDIDIKLLDAEQMSMLRKFYIKCQTKNFIPKVIVEYERTPYIYEIGNVRITFDRNITACGNISDFMEPTIMGRPVMPVGQHILEVKFDELLPDYLHNVMQIKKIQRTAYSKYSICRKYSI